MIRCAAATESCGFKAQPYTHTNTRTHAHAHAHAHTLIDLAEEKRSGKAKKLVVSKTAIVAVPIWTPQGACPGSNLGTSGGFLAGTQD